MCVRFRPCCLNALLRAGLGLLMSGLAPQSVLAEKLSRFSSRVWRMEDGLPHSIVQCIAQTREGYLWVGTREGLARFDGVRFTELSLRPWAAHPEVRCLCEGRDGSLWIGTETAGLLRLQGGVLTHYGRAEGLRSEMVRVLQEADDGSLWIGSNMGLVQWQDGKLQRPGPAAANCGLVRTMSRDREGRLWAATDNRLLRIKGQSIATQALAEGMSSKNILAMFGGADGTLWLGRAGGLSLLQNGVFAHYEKGAGAAGMIDALLQDRTGHVWVGTYSGLSRFTADTFTSEGLEESGAYRVYALFEDREGTLWVGSEEGLVQLQPRRFTTYTTKEGLTGNTIVSVCPDRDGSIWIGAWGGGLNCFKDGHITTYGEGEGLASSFVRALHQGRDGSLWVGTDYQGGLYRFKDGRFTHYGAAQGLDTFAILALLEDAAGHLWVGSREGLFCLQGPEVRHYTERDGLSHKKINALCEDASGGLWVGTDSGLTRWNGASFDRPAPGLLHGVAVLSLYLDRAGSLWVGAAGVGLGQLQHGKFNLFTTRQGLFSDTIYSILEDDRANLWLNSSKGIFRVSKAELEAVAGGARPAFNSIRYGKSDGILSSGQSQESTQSAGCRGLDGRLWFRTAQGAVVVDPAELAPNPFAPPVLIEEVLADRKPVPPPGSGGQSPEAQGDVPPAGRSASGFGPGTLDLPPGRGELEIHYTALSLRAAERNRFRYQLEGVDEDWVEAGTRRFAYYAHLAPGTYRFRVLGSNNDGVWSEAGASLALVLQPHFWQTWWFFGGCALSAAGSLAGTVRYVTWRRLQRRLERLERQRAIEQERTRIARDMHDELGARLTRISFQGGTAKRHLDNPSEVERRIEEMSRTAREAVASLHEIVWAVDPENDSLEGVANYICRYASRFFEESPVGCQFLIPTELPACRLSTNLRHHLLLALKEALNNTLKHAGASQVQIQIATRPQELELMVTDNGRGFEANPAGQAPPGETRRAGQGLANMKKRLRALGGHCEIRSEPGEGTTIRFLVPLEQSYIYPT